MQAVLISVFSTEASRCVTPIGMNKVLVSMAFFFGVVGAVQARPIAVVDLDHTVFHTNFRIQKILSDLGKKHKILELEHVTLAEIIEFRSIREAAPLAQFIERVQPTFKDAFYRESSYLDFEAPMLGAQSFLSELVDVYGFDLVYLTGRGSEAFFDATKVELARANYPGFGARADLHEHVRLILKPESFSGTTAEFKVEQLKSIESELSPIVAIFDDSSRNLTAFYLNYGSRVVLVRIGQYRESELDTKISSHVVTLKHFLISREREELLRKLSNSCVAGLTKR